MQHNYRPAGVATLGTFTPDNLIAGGFPVQTKSVQLKHGVNYARGAVLQVSSTAGIYEKVTTDASAIYILLEDRDLSAATAAQPGVVAMTGEFNKPALSLGAGATLAGVAAALEAKNIVLRDTVPVITAD
jgi:predicted nicotinamide N-methyase